MRTRKDSSNVKIRLDSVFKDARQLVIPDFTMEDVDASVVKWLKDLELIAHKDNGERIDVNITFTTEERWNAAQVEKGILDARRTVKLPLVTMYRSKFVPNVERYVYRGVPQGPHTNTVALRIPWKEKSDLSRRPLAPHAPHFVYWRPLYRIVQVPAPVFADFTYELKIQTDYFSHGNQLIEQIYNDNIYFWVTSEKGYGFHCSMSEPIAREIADLATNDRMIINELTITAYAYLIPQYTVNIPTETSIVSDTANRLVITVNESIVPR